MVKRLQQPTGFYFKHFMIDSLPLMGRYFCKQILPFWLDNRDVHCAESVTKLDDAWWGKIQVCRPHVQIWGLSEANVLFWKKVLMTLLGLVGPPRWFCARELFPFYPSLCLWYYAIKIGKFSDEHVQFSKSIRHGSCTDCPQRLLAAVKVSSCSFVSLLCLLHAFFGVDLCLFC